MTWRNLSFRADTRPSSIASKRLTLGVDDLDRAVRFYRDAGHFLNPNQHLWEIAWNPDVIRNSS